MESQPQNPEFRILKTFTPVHKTVITFLSLNFNMCFGCSKELSQ